MRPDGEAGIRFEILGPLRAWRGPTPVSLGPAQRRAVLAVLLLNANRPVGRQQLVEALWGEAIPGCAVNLLQRHVSSLRRVLDDAPASASRLTWTDAGYRLEVAAGALDLAVSDAEQQRARVARARGDLPAAAEALARAVRLWRGPSFEGLPGPYLQQQRAALAERRVGLAEEWIEAELALGRHRDHIATLRRLLAEEPLRERLYELLMIALYRSDRQAEALAVFQQARRRLRDDCGIDPAEPLRLLHRRILAADPDLKNAAGETGVTDAVPVEPARDDDRSGGPAAAGQTPAQLPLNIPDFTGRDDELVRLDRLLDDGGGPDTATPVVAISGTAGIGKTALAVHWAHRVRDRFPDGQLYVNLRGFDPGGAAVQPGEAIRGFLDAFAVPPQRIPISPDAQAGLYRSLLAGKRVLIVLDNARDAQHVRPLLPGAPGCLVVITSRDQLAGLIVGQDARPVTVDLLSAVEARRLLARRIGRARVDAEPGAVEDIIDACARLPLALTIVAARAAVHPKFSLAVLAGQLRTAYSGLDAFDDGDAETDVRGVFGWSYRTLSGGAARMFRRLALHPGPDIAVPAAAALTGGTIREARRQLAELSRAHLVTEHAPGRFAFHDLLRAYAGEQTSTLDTPADRRAAIHRMLDHYLQTAGLATARLSRREDPLTLIPPAPGTVCEDIPDRTRALAWFTAEHPVLVAAVGRAAAHDFAAHSWQLAWTLTTFLFYQGHLRDQLLTAQVALDTARRSGDRCGQAYTHLSLARVRTRLGDFADARAHHQLAFDLFTGLADGAGRARTQLSTSWMYDQQRRYPDALRHAELALELYRACEHQVGWGRALNAVGWYRARLGSPQESLSICRQALAMLQEAGDREGEANTWDSLGYAYHALGAFDEAVRAYEQALEGFQDLGDRYNETDSLTRLGDALHAAGDADAAYAAWGRAVTILDELRHPDDALIRARLEPVEPAPIGR
ncbi:BTAD domain-containing putative transcriptional regulator [Amorphoplanes nipponensis]|uniref:SARP family transcriptional regulator n=1 Tax=Actinoplanes nipponensis TaxID=135950 RepID=A0A919JR36_9ACTN|nr:BTAD domain-containing putative transcriptional regulator [Actinoplanes nipponensis]GIE53920.1 SARP family transcriptional regulator [Actinoplanes nipponensis]